MTTVRDILSALHRAAPLELQQPWDNCGLQLGDPAAKVSTVLVAMDTRAAVVAEAAKVGADCLVTHHPLLFQPLKQISADNAVGRAAMDLIRSNTALISAHTNYDAAPGGLNDLLARTVGLEDCQPFDHPEASQGLRLCVFVPPGDLEQVERAIFEAGAGQIGNYCHCAFRSKGTGSFVGQEGSHPSVGEAGREEEVEEIRLETVVPPERVEAVIRALRAAHSYEEAAYGLVPTRIVHDRAGLGRVGDLPRAVSPATFVGRIKKALGLPMVEVVGQPKKRIRRVALVCGGGGSLWRAARATGADLFLTGEMKHNERAECADAGFAAIVAGHYATEHLAVEGLAELLGKALPREVRVRQSRRETDPTSWL